MGMEVARRCQGAKGVPPLLRKPSIAFGVRACLAQVACV